MLHDELQFFIDNQEELVEKYEGQVLVIRDQQVVGVYDTALSAYLASVELYEPGTFLIQSCEQGAGAYTVTLSTHDIID